MYCGNWVPTFWRKLVVPNLGYTTNSSRVLSAAYITLGECVLKWLDIYTYIHSFGMLFSGTYLIPLCHIPVPSILFHQSVFYPPSLHLAICFLVYLSASLFPNSYIILFWEFCFLPSSLHTQTNVIYFTLMPLL